MARPASDRRPILCLVVDRTCSRTALTEAVEAAAAAGVDWVQLRERDLDGRPWLDWAESIDRAARRGSGDVRVIVNRRIDVALALGADGVHLGFDALAAADARTLLGASAEIGLSTHRPDEAAGAVAAGATYIHLAPIYAPISKPAERPALGEAALARACRQRIPVLAQGGIDAERCGAVLAAGAAGIAVTGAILLADRPGDATARLRAAMDAAAGWDG